jgi:hypothetical protein
MLPDFQDLCGVDFDVINDQQAKALNDRIVANYRNSDWLHDIITERANIEFMFNDSYGARLKFTTAYPFEVLVFNVTTLANGFHSTEHPSHGTAPIGRLPPTISLQGRWTIT